jgi:hypothetical protein
MDDPMPVIDFDLEELRRSLGRRAFVVRHRLSGHPLFAW